jgi:hypothetical protein
MSTIYEGQDGTIIDIDCGEDMSTAIGLKMELRRADKSTLDVSATLSATDNNHIQHTITAASGELTTYGKYSFQAYAEIGTWKGYGDPVEIDYKKRHT